MKVTCSPLIASLSGRAADAVAASWKGVLYVRKHVVPHNPKSAGQIAQRGYMARMSPMFRSLPTAIKTWLDDLAVGLGKSGFNLMVAEDLKHLADAEDPQIVPANPNENAVFSIADGAGASGQIDITWVAGSADSTHFVHAFTCPVDPDEVAKTEPDGWTYHSGEVEQVTTGAAGSFVVSNVAKDYHVVAIVADHVVLATAANYSGGIGATIASGA